MGRKALESGTLDVWPGDRDADELRAIRASAWSYDRLVGWADQQEEALKALDNDRSPLPAKPDLVAIDTLICNLVQRAHDREASVV